MSYGHNAQLCMSREVITPPDFEDFFCFQGTDDCHCEHRSSSQSYMLPHVPWKSLWPPILYSPKELLYNQVESFPEMRCLQHFSPIDLTLNQVVLGFSFCFPIFRNEPLHPRANFHSCLHTHPSPQGLTP